MTRLTNYELQQRLSKANAELELLRAELQREKFAREAIEAELAHLRKREIELELNLASTVSVATELNRTNGPAARKQAMEAAREMAMKTRTCVKV